MEKRGKIIGFKNSALWRWIFLWLIIIIFHFPHRLDSDDGLVLSGAWHLLNGQIPYSDFFAFVTPGGFYLIFIIWKIFGVSYLAAKMVSIAFLFFGSFGLYKITDYLTGKKPLAYLSALMLAISAGGWPIINYNSYNIVFLIWAVYFFLKVIDGLPPAAHSLPTPTPPYQKKGGLCYAFGAGLLWGISFLFLQSRTIAVMAVMLLFLIGWPFAHFKKLLATAGLFILGGALPALWLLKWPVATLKFALYEFPLRHYLATNRVSLGLFITCLLCFLIVVFLIKNKNRKIIFLSALQAVLLITALSRPDYQHLTLILFPLYALAAVVISQIQQKIILNKGALAAFFIACLLIMSIIWQALANNFAPLPPTSGNLKLLMENIKNNCSSPYLYAGPFLPGLYFETRKLSAVSYQFLITNQQTEAQFTQARQELEKNPPDCAVLNYVMTEKFKYDQNNPVDSYLAKNYHKIYKQDRVLIYKINNLK